MSLGRKRLLIPILLIGLSGLLMASFWWKRIHGKSELVPLLTNATPYGFAGRIGRYEWLAPERLLKEKFSPPGNTFTEIDLKNSVSTSSRFPFPSAFMLPILPFVLAVSPSGEWLCLESKHFKTTPQIALLDLRTGKTSIRTRTGLFAGWLPDSSGWVSFQFTDQSIAVTVQYRNGNHAPVTVNYPLRQRKTFRWPLGITNANEVVVAEWEMGNSSNIDVALLPLFGEHKMKSVVIPIPTDRSVVEVAFCPSQSRLALHMQEVFVPWFNLYSPRMEDIWVSDLTGRVPQRLGSVKVEVDDSGGSDLSTLRWNWDGTQIAFTFAGELYLK